MVRAPIDLDRGADVSIDPSLVPALLHHMIPTAARWAFTSLDDQDAFAVRLLRERPVERPSP